MATKELSLYTFIELGLLFLLINYNPSLAIVYAFMTILAHKIYFEDTNVEYPISRPSISFSNAFIKAGIAYAIFFYLTPIITQFFGAQPMSVIDVFSQTVPAFAGSPTLAFISYAILIAIIETTYFFLRIFERIKEIAKPQMNSFLNKAFIIMFISALFTIFHVTAKGTTDFVPLITTFLFATTSMVLIITQKEGKSAIFLHMIANGLAMLKRLGVLGVGI